MVKNEQCDTKNAYLQQANSDTESHTGAAKRTLVIRHGPRVACEGLENAGQLELALLYWEKESSCAESLLGHRLARTRGSTGSCAETEHVLDLLRGVFLTTTENVGFTTFRIANFMNLSLDQCEQ